jgi:signal transduction histidine kinase
MTAPPVRRLRQRARGWSLRRRVAVAFGAFAVLFAIAMTATAISLADFVGKGNEVVHRWEPAAAASQNLFIDLVNQETGVRGYVLSRNSSFLQPFEQYSKQQALDEQRVRDLARGHPVVTQNLATLHTVATQWHDLVAVPLISLVNAHDPSARTLIDDPDGKGRFDLVRKASATLTASVDRVNAAAVHDRAIAMRALIVALAVSVGLLTVAGAISWRALHTWVLRPVEALAVQARDVAEGTGQRRIRPAGPPELRDLGNDVETMRRRIADELARLEQASDELARSNADLEQFAYVASHDLSEPLRKVANFCQLLERQYGDQLDERAKQYIAFAVDGAKRMQALIADLLALSRVGRSTEQFVPVDTNQALQHAIANLEDRIAAAGGGVGSSELPTVPGDPTLLVSLFENLVGNAVKYRGDEPPHVAVSAVLEREQNVWTFTVRDNGIGIEPQYADRIFAIFQRLHLRGQYPGTGIGLALCRRIVEFHGGRIWLDTSSVTGATFRFTLPAARADGTAE